jgi:hypothetical protein
MLFPSCMRKDRSNIYSAHCEEDVPSPISTGKVFSDEVECAGIDVVKHKKPVDGIRVFEPLSCFSEIGTLVR